MNESMSATIPSRLTRGAQVAAVICAANAVWSVWWLCVAALSGWGCGGSPKPGESCGDAGGILLAWYLSEWIAVAPTIVAGVVLLRRWRGASRHPLGRIGIGGLVVFAVAANVALIAMFVAH